jgi:hypothetical protein
MVPTVVSYLTVMGGWAKCNHKDSVKKMENLFKSMKQLSVSLGDENSRSVQPNQWMYTTLIHAYARQNDVIAMEKVENLIHEIYDQYLQGHTELKLNTILVTAVLQAWGKTGTTTGAEQSETLLDWMISESGVLAPNEFSFSSAYVAVIWFCNIFILTILCVNSCHCHLG